MSTSNSHSWNDNLLPEIDFSQISESPNSELALTSSFFKDQVENITASPFSSIEDLITPDKEFLDKIPSGNFSSTSSQLTPVSRFQEDVSAFPTLIVDENDTEDIFWADSKLGQNEVTKTINSGNNVNNLVNNTGIITWLSLKFPELRLFFEKINNDENISPYLKNKIFSFFSWKDFTEPLKPDYNYKKDEWFIWTDTPIETIHRFWFILLYFMYEFWIGIHCSGGPEYWAHYITKNFITDKNCLDRFPHINVSENRRNFWSKDKPKAYVQFTPEVKREIVKLFNFLLNYAKSQKKALDKLKEDEERSRRFAERMEKIRKRDTWELENKPLLNKIDKIADDLWIDDII